MTGVLLIPGGGAIVNVSSMAAVTGGRAGGSH